MTSLGVHIIGWNAARRAICAPAPALLVAELEQLTTASEGRRGRAERVLANGGDGRGGRPEAPKCAVSRRSPATPRGALRVSRDTGRPQRLLDAHIINLARASDIAHDAVDAASQAVLAVRRAANADGRHLVDNARHLVKIAVSQ